MSLRKVFWQALGVLVCLMFALPALAQSTGGRIIGRVTDPTGAVVSGAKVTLANEATGASRAVETGASGDYTLLSVPVGTYTVTIEHANFKKNVHKGVTLELNQVLTLDAVLQVGARTEVVEVTGQAPLVDTTSTQLGAVVNNRAVAGLPLSSRDTYQLLQLQPGVQSNIGQDLFYGSDAAGAVTVNGGRSRSNNFTVNGGDANDSFVNAPVIQPAPDTIEEFRVITNTFDAEFGRNSGAVVNVVTKSGTNNFHGNVYEFFRNEKLNARGFLDPRRPAFKQNQFGVTFGGPIWKDRTFFFVSYEGRRLRKEDVSDVVTIPTTAERAGDFSAGSQFFPGFPGPFAAGDCPTNPSAGVNCPPSSISDPNVANVLNARTGCAAAIAANTGTPPAAGVAWTDIFPGNIIPTECFDPTAFDLLNQFVPPDLGGNGAFQGLDPRRENGTQFTARFDHKISDRHQLSVYYFFSDAFISKPFARFQAGGANVPGFGDESDQRFQQWNISHTWVINPTTVNEFRFSYFRQGQETFFHPVRTHALTDSCTAAVASCFTGTLGGQAIGITPGLGATREGVPFITIDGGFSIGNNFEGELPAVGNVFQWSDSFSKVMGKHSLKFGGDVRRQRYDQTLFFDVNGQYNFFGGGPNDVIFDNLFPNYLLGLPDFYLQGSAQEERVRVTSVYLFGQDSWRIKPNLTLNYGLRWELNTPITDVGQKVQTFRPGQATQIFPCQLTPASATALGFNPVTELNCNPGGPAASVFPLGLVVPGDQGVQAGLTQTYYRSFAPRIGLAWSPGAKDGWIAKLTGGPGKTSVRMGWGLFYNPIEQLVLEQFSAEPPFGGSSGLSNILFNTPFEHQDGSTAPNPFGGILNPPRGQPVDWSRFRPILLFGQFQPNMRSQYSVQYNLNIQRELARDLVLQIGYVGSQGHRLLATHDLNPGNPQTCVDLQAISDSYAPFLADGTPNPSADSALNSAYACGAFFADSAFSLPANSIPAGFTLHLPYGSVPTVSTGNSAITLVGLRPFSSPICEPTTGAGCPPDGVPVFSSVFAQDTIAHSNYHSLQILVEKRFSRGLQFTGAYTWSKSIDNASSFENILAPADFGRSRSLSLFHAAHRAVFSYYWELPVAKHEGFAGTLLNGWALSGITTFQTGFPIRIRSDDDNELMFSFDFELPGRPDLVGPFTRMDPRKNPDHRFFDPSAFAAQGPGTLGSAPRTVCCGPSINNWDFAIHKNTPIRERMKVEFRAEFFNLFNRSQFFNPDGNITDGDEFGTIKRAKDPRQIQFAVKLSF